MFSESIEKNQEIISKYIKDKHVKSRAYIKKINKTRNDLLEETYGRTKI